MRRRALLGDALAMKHAARTARLADEADRCAWNCQAINDFALRDGFRERGTLPGVLAHPPQALWFSGKRCFMGAVWRSISDSPESAGERTLEHLQALAHAFDVERIDGSLYVVVLDTRSELKRWGLATRGRIRDAGLAVVGQGGTVRVGEYGFGIVYPLAPAVIRPAYVYRGAACSPTLPRSRGPRDVGQ
jgi:hypothetical protein